MQMRILACLMLLVIEGAAAAAFLSPMRSRGSTGGAFAPQIHQNWHRQQERFGEKSALSLSANAGAKNNLVPVSPNEAQNAIPFVDPSFGTPEYPASMTGFIECFPDAVATVNGVRYTIGFPRDTAVALCYQNETTKQYVSLGTEEAMMDDVYTMAEKVVEDEFGEELVLQRTPQTLTLVGDYGKDSEFDFNDYLGQDEKDVEFEDDNMEEEDAEAILTFEHRGREFTLVRVLEPVLLVGKIDEKSPKDRQLLTKEESQQVMAELENLVIKFYEKQDDKLEILNEGQEEELDAGETDEEIPDDIDVGEGVATPDGLEIPDDFEIPEGYEVADGFEVPEGYEVDDDYEVPDHDMEVA